jgi:hypothetical protein
LQPHGRSLSDLYGSSDTVWRRDAVIKSFTANGGAVSEIIPGGDVTLRQQVEGADRVAITAVLGCCPVAGGIRSEIEER